MEKATRGYNMKVLKDIFHIITSILLMISIVGIPYIIWTQSIIDDTAKLWLCMCVMWMQANILREHCKEDHNK